MLLIASRLGPVPAATRPDVPTATLRTANKIVGVVAPADRRKQRSRRPIFISITRRQLVEEGFEAVMKRKYNPNSARPRIFDGVAEAKLIALTLSPAPEGFARWSLRLLELILILKS
jgi:hypothetical protein